MIYNHKLDKTVEACDIDIKDLKGANLRGADLRGAKYTQEQIDSAITGETTKF